MSIVKDKTSKRGGAATLMVILTVLVSVAFFIKGENKMSLFSNPANWSIVNKLQGQSNKDASGLDSTGTYNGTLAYNSNTGQIEGSTGGGVFQPVSDVNQAANLFYPQAGATTQADPYAKYGGQANYNNLVSQYQSGLGNIRQNATDAFGSAKNSLQGSAENLFNSVKSGQQGINQSRANNELNRMNGIQDILSYVRNGLQQGGSRLAANNATESSAAGALANAYSQLGNQKARAVNQGAGLQNNQLDLSQQQLNDQQAAGLTDFHRARDEQVNQIGSQLRQQLAALDQQAVSASLPDRIAIDQEKQRLIDEGQGQLQAVDQWLQGQLGTIAPQSRDQILATAQGLRSAGTALPNPFAQQFAQQQVQGPAVDQLPLFTRNKKIA